MTSNVSLTIQLQFFKNDACEKCFRKRQLVNLKLSKLKPNKNAHLLTRFTKSEHHFWMSLVFQENRDNLRPYGHVDNFLGYFNSY